MAANGAICWNSSFVSVYY